MAELQAVMCSSSCSLPQTFTSGSTCHQQSFPHDVGGNARVHLAPRSVSAQPRRHLFSRTQILSSRPYLAGIELLRGKDVIKPASCGSCPSIQLRRHTNLGSRRQCDCLRLVRAQVSDVSSESAPASESPEPVGEEVVANLPSTESESGAQGGVSAQKKSLWRPGEKKGFVEEMRIRAMKLHTKDQSKEGEKETQGKPLAKWQPTVQGYIQFLVDSKVVHDTMESIIADGSNPMYQRFLNTGLERSAALAQDLEWFASQGHNIPGPDIAGTTYAKYLQELAESNPPAFICHFYNVYFAHSAGGRMIGRKVADMILDGKELEFYQWEGDLQEHLTHVRTQLNEVAQEWLREEKDVCLNETELSFKYSGEILRLLAT